MSAKDTNQWFVYILQCKDDTFYIGATNNIEKRVMIHNQAKGAKYTRSRLPVKIVYQEKCFDKSEALKREHALKKLTHTQKASLLIENS